MFDGPLLPELDPAERRARLRLARSKRIGPVTFHEALQHFGSARAVEHATTLRENINRVKQPKVVFSAAGD
jgi:predicted Rossmann fold nucleotide-binding protein DprA/Smf involved in DNA uptake